MADANDRVMAMVQDELEKNPNISVNELQEKAQKIDPAMADLNTRQFHARYPLQVKRAQAVSKGAAKGGRKRRAGKKASKPAAARKGGRRSGAKAAEAPTEGARRGRRASGGESVKAVLVDFAGKIAGADTTTLVKVMGDLDNWVERVNKASD